MVDLSKAKKGDRVKFRCGGEATIFFIGEESEVYRIAFRANVAGFKYFEWGEAAELPDSLFDIIAIEPAPFDWSTVKPGMAFNYYCPATQKHKVWWYVGPAFGVGGYPQFTIVVTNNKNMDCSDQLHFAAPKDHKLTRAPEHDLPCVKDSQ